MSRIGKKVIEIPQGVNITFDEPTRNLMVKGSLGQLEVNIHPDAILEIEAGKINVKVKDESLKFQRSLWGTTRAIVFNAVSGVTTHFTKEVELNGVGYRMELGTELILYIGFSHPVKVVIPASIKLTLVKNVLSGTSINKQELGNFFSNIHNMKPCDVYKQKGFKFPNRFYLKKVGKRGK